MFNPEEQFEEARRQNPALDEAYRKSEEAVHDYLEPLVDFFNRLAAEIETMPIAQRFRRDKKPILDYSPSDRVWMPTVTNLNEADFKRAQLRDDLRSIRNRASVISNSIQGIILDMEATKRD